MPKLNSELMLKVAEKLDSLGDDQQQLYNQSAFNLETGCGTAHCIGGWAIIIDGKFASALFFWPYRILIGDPFRPWDTARDLLGLTRDEANTLFDEDFMPGADSHDVANALRDFARSGRVDLREGMNA